jgi:hypothetical protein
LQYMKSANESNLYTGHQAVTVTLKSTEH